VQKVPVCGVIAGVGNKPEDCSGGRIGRFETLPHGIGSSALGIVYGFVGVESLDSKYAREPDSAGGVGKLDGPRSPLRWSGLERFELLTPPNSTPSRAGVRCGMIDLHELVEPDDDVGGTDEETENLRTISVHRLKRGSGMCSFQSIAARKAISLLLISLVLNPDILLHARAE
jgi:hypothetical protein